MNLTPQMTQNGPQNVVKVTFVAMRARCFLYFFFTLAVLAVRLVVWTFGGKNWVVLGSNSMNGGVKIVKS